MKINQRLFDWYGIDTGKNLNINRVCAKPFDTLLIDKTGSCFLCECTSWLPQSVGNLQIESIEDLWSNKMSEVIRQTVSDKTYKLCNENQCPYIKSKYIKTTDIKELRYLRLAIDDSCNLKCPSCRLTKIYLHKGKEFQRRMLMAKKILAYLEKTDHKITVHIGSDGDPFASIVYRYILKNFPDKKNITFNLQTNGLLLKKFHLRNSVLFNRLEILNISMDGATADVYEKLRLGGKWSQLYENLSYISRLKRNFKIHIHMVVQQDNWHQMDKMLELVNKLNFDKVFFNPIQDWNSGIDFSKQTYHKNKEFRDKVKTIKKNEKARVWLLS